MQNTQSRPVTNQPPLGEDYMPLQAIAVERNKVEIKSYKLPEPSSDHVHVRTLYSLVSQGTELSTIRGAIARFSKSWSEDLRLFGANDDGPKTFPVSLGYSCVGRVERTGSAVTGLKPGDIVWLDRPHQEEHLVPESEAILGLCVPGVDPRRYTFRVLTKVALAAVHDAHPFLGSSVAVVGLGIIGQIVVDLLLASGVTNIFAVDTSNTRLKMAEQANVHCINASATDAGLAIKRHFGKGVDMAIEVSGTYQGLSTAIRSVGVGGRVITVSTYTGSPEELNLGEEYHRNRVELISSMSVNGCPHRGYPQWDAARLLETTRYILDTGVVRPERLITDVVPLDQLPALYDELGHGGGSDRMGIVISY